MSNGVASIEDYPMMQTGTVALAPDGTFYGYVPPSLDPPITPPPATIEGYPAFTTMGLGVDADGGIWQYAPTQPGGIIPPEEVIPPPVNTLAPRIQMVSGNPVPGQQAVNANPGTWAPPATGGYQRQWRLSGTAIPGATTVNYTIQEADVGARLTCGVIAIGDGGPSQETPSNELIVVDVPPLDEGRFDDNGGAQAPPRATPTVVRRGGGSRTRKKR